ncbi:MAG: type IX secretion system sortase PorU [Spirosomataceae bacterium]
MGINKWEMGNTAREIGSRHSTFDIQYATFHFLLGILFFILHSSFFNVKAQNSVLSEGRWFKIGITKTAVYRLDASFLKQLGLNIAEINPKNLRLYGNGGAMLPQRNDAPRATDLTENAVLIKGEADGRFDEGDALWFFGESPHQIRYNTLEKRLEHQLNLYSDTTFYFLKIDTQAGLRVQSQAAGNSGALINTFDDYVFRETENYNRIQSGREWWGEYFGSQTRQDFNADINGLLPDSPIKLTVASVAAAQVTTQFLVSVNGQSLGEQTMGTVSTFRYDSKGQRTQKTYQGKLSNAINRATMSFTFDKAGQANADGYLDFFGLQMQRTLRLYDQATVFQNISTLSQDSVRYLIAQATPQMQLWDITNPLKPSSQSYRLNGTEATFGSAGKTLKRFVVFTEAQLQIPLSVQPVVNQNIRALPTPNLLIVTAPFVQKQAQQLANFRRQNDGLEVGVVTTTQLYNEFGGGQADPTAIRDFTKYLNDRQPNKFRYLLLFGDASYDYKNNLKAFSPLEMAYFVPTYESRESGHPVFSFSSDDYFGFLKPTDGDWEEDFNGNHLLDIGVGRLPVKSIVEAEAVVSKLIRYNTKRSRGTWRQRIAFVADDGDANLHQKDADNLSKIIKTTTPTYNLRKVFVDAYPQIGTSAVRAPEVNKAIDRYVNEGVLIMNYTGHGGTSIWADEQILTLQNLLNWRNLDNMPLIITATCEFGRYDNPAEVSGAEIAVLSPRGGAIAMLTTARPVYASTNFLLNEAFYRAAFQAQNGQMPRLGDLIRVTKNNSLSSVLNRNFTLLGDPSLRLNYPDYEVKITTNDTLEAGSLVKFSGEIIQKNERVEDFEGTAIITVYDKENQLVTLGHDEDKMNYEQYESKLFEGQVSVKKGSFLYSWSFQKIVIQP